MKEKEILGLILVMYDYKCDRNTATITLGGCEKQNAPIELYHQPHEYLKRKGYLDKYEGRPTLKFYKLLYNWGIEIKQLKEWQDEYAATKHVTQYDAIGNKHIL